VIHSFFVPAFRLKRDVLPDRYTTFWFQATKPGTYSLFCAEFCGADHSRMRGRVVVMEPKGYQDWLAGQDVGASPAVQGRALFTAYGCSGCHAAGSSVHAPRLEGLFGRPVHLSDGRTVLVDDNYIRDSILLPRKQIAAGYEPIMPSFQGQASESDILKLIAYIKSLGTERGNKP
jgi:cytochrome c oxidase subunit 2